MLLFIPQTWAGSNPAPAPAAVVKGDFQSMKHSSSNRVDKIIDAETVLMKDGKIVRLLGLNYPLGSQQSQPEQPYQAKQLLDKILPEGSEVMLWQSFNSKTGRVNRMGQILAHLETKKDGQWINGRIIAEGLASAMTTMSNPEMADQLYALEQKARAGKKGLWTGNSAEGMLTPETAANGDSQFRVVTGKVSRAATSNNNLYLNFGTDWKKDFTVMVTPDLRKKMSKRGIDAMALPGTDVRVRGWIREWNGPFMELETVERLEILPSPSNQLPLPAEEDMHGALPKAGQTNP